MAESQRRQPRGHFADEAWADFARGLSEPAEKVRLQQHLAEGCERCAHALAVWARVVERSGQEAAYEPPADALAQAKAHFALYRPSGLVERAAARVSLIFDSLRQPVLAGVRAAGPSPRHLLYKAGRYLIRLQVESQPGAQRLLVVGQIVDESTPKTTLHNLPVSLLSEEQTLDRTLTNNLGEFELTSDPSESLRLSVGIPEIGTLTLPGLLAGPGGRGDVSGTRGGSGRGTRARHA